MGVPATSYYRPAVPCRECGRATCLFVHMPFPGGTLPRPICTACYQRRTKTKEH